MHAGIKVNPCNQKGPQMAKTWIWDMFDRVNKRIYQHQNSTLGCSYACNYIRYISISLDMGLAWNRWQAIISTNDGPDCWWIYMLLDQMN